MTRGEQEERARAAVIERLRATSPVPTHDLVAVCEAAGGLCPRDGRRIVGRLVAARRLVNAGGGMTARGPSFPLPVAAAAAAAHTLRRV